VQSLKYTYATNYRDNDVLRYSFNELTKKTFSFNFEEWFNEGFWSEKYIPCSLVDGDKVIANVSVNLMDFNMDGTEKHYIQIGTVMTDAEYRRQGLSRYLIEKIIAEYKEKVDGIYLFGNDKVVNFYPKFGFTKGTEYQYSKAINAIDKKEQIEHVNIFNKTNRERFLNKVKSCVSNDKFSMDNFGLTAFWTMGPMHNLIYYYAAEDAYLIADIKEERLWLHQIISTHKVNLEKVISSFGSNIKKVSLGFTPNDSDGYDEKELHKEDCTLFYLGKDLENIQKNKLMFPTLSHA
jgi:predicted GNAT family N-acyltransferase